MKGHQFKSWIFELREILREINNSFTPSGKSRTTILSASRPFGFHLYSYSSGRLYSDPREGIGSKKAVCAY